MNFGRLMWLVAGVTLCVAGGVSAAETGDVLKEKGLSKSGAVYVLPDEAPVLEGIKDLRATKLQADKETRARGAIDAKIVSKQKVIKDADKQWHELEAKLGVVQKADVHNRIVTRMNRLIADHKEAIASLKELDEQAGQASTVAKTKFVDDMVSLNEKAGAVAEKYQALAADPAVKSSVAKAKGTLGPSPAFAAALGELKKWQGEVESETIPLREESGIHHVDVLLNGEHFVMGLDTGASMVGLTGEVAEKLKMVPGEKDPTVQLSLANGSIIEGKEMTLKSVRVGRFTVDDVRCVVLEKGLPNAPLILGGSFLNHFIVKLDPGAHQLHLTELKQDNPKKLGGAAATPSAGTGTGKKPAAAGSSDKPAK